MSLFGTSSCGLSVLPYAEKLSAKCGERAALVKVIKVKASKEHSVSPHKIISILCILLQLYAVVKYFFALKR